MSGSNPEEAAPVDHERPAVERVKLSKVGGALTVTLPAYMAAALHLRENDEVALEAVGNRIILTHGSPDFQQAWAAYQALEPRYHNANRKLAE